ncbi:unnamed protein product [Arabidopsis halleri]
MECASSDVNGLSNIHLQRLENKTSWAMLDLEVLHCPICFEPLTIPIFECGNGHLACSSCCPKLSNKCPSCSLPIGHNRCRAMESVLESVFVPCQNAELGCTKNVSYGKQSSHDPECIFSRCTCPAQGCNFTSLYKDLYGHYKSYIHHLQSHGQEYMRNRFSCGISFSAKMNIISDTILIKCEDNKGLLFAVHCFKERDGVYVTVSCITPAAPQVGEFSYHFLYNVEGHTITFKSSKVKRILEVSFQTPQENFLFIPQMLLRGELLDMNICIKHLDEE